jgi:hypothetical protein
MRSTIRLTGRVEDQLPTELQAELLEAFRGWRAS